MTHKFAHRQDLSRPCQFHFFTSQFLGDMPLSRSSHQYHLFPSSPSMLTPHHHLLFIPFHFHQSPASSSLHSIPPSSPSIFSDRPHHLHLSFPSSFITIITFFFYHLPPSPLPLIIFHFHLSTPSPPPPIIFLFHFSFQSPSPPPIIFLFHLHFLSSSIFTSPSRPLLVSNTPSAST